MTPGQACRFVPHGPWTALGLCLVLAAPGCSARRSTAPPPEAGAVARLPDAPVVLPSRHWRLRLPAGHPWPTAWSVRLDDQLTLVVIRDEASWREVFAAWNWPAPPTPDLAGGAVVGVIADLGQADRRTWPISLDYARVADGRGLLVGQLSLGDFHPLRGPTYAELVHIPGLREVRIVQLNERVFVVR